MSNMSLESEDTAPESAIDLDPVGDVSVLDEYVYDLPIVESLPPSEVQARMESPVFFMVGGHDGAEQIDAYYAPTTPGVEKTWTEPEDLEREAAGEVVDIPAQVQSSTGGAP